MISLKNIRVISAYEAKVLWRNWFFRIIALLGVGFIAIFNIVVFSEVNTPEWLALSNSWVMPYATMVMISIPQVAAVIFLATGLIKKDKKLDTNEVFFVRPITNLDYVLGKALALFKLFFSLNAVLLLIPLIVNLTSPFTSFNPLAFVLYPLLTSIPSIVFTTGIAFLLVTLIKNQPITIVLLLGIAAVELIYYYDQFSNILDFMAFRLPAFTSEMSGFADIKFTLWQRSFYLLIGIAFLFLTAFSLDRLSSHRRVRRATGLIGVALLALSSLIMLKLWSMHHDPISLRQERIAVNGKWAKVPNINIISNAIDLELIGDEIVATSEMVVKNNTNKVLDQLYFTLNPGLLIDEVLINDKSVAINRDLQIISMKQGIGIAPGQETKVRIRYHGTISESAAHLEVDQKRYEAAIEYFMFSLQKKYAFLQPDYVLLTKDVLWYPDTQIGHSRKSTAKQMLSFVDFDLTVKTPKGLVPISQGEEVVDGNVHQFKPEYPLPQISLIVGKYEKKEITVDSVTYAVYHYPENDYFVKQLDQLSDTLSYLISDIVNEYEDAQKLSYPFRRLRFVEVPQQFTAYNKIYESHQAFVQPEMVLWPEEGGDIREFDFRKQLFYMDYQAREQNQSLTDKQKQANVFNNLIKNVFINADAPDYSLFPNYYAYNTGIVSQEWALLNIGMAFYLRNDQQTKNDYSRDRNGISFTEECNNLMRESSIREILKEAAFNKIQRSVALKSEYLFSYLSQRIGESVFKAFLYDWINAHQHQLTPYEAFREALLLKFSIDIDPIIRKVYFDTEQPAFEIVNLQEFEVLDDDRKRYQVLVDIKNSGDNDGVIAVKIDADVSPHLSVIRQGETKRLGFVRDEKPRNITVNTIISKNIPSVITMPLGSLMKHEGGSPFEGERVVDEEEESQQYEVIVDNTDPGFTTFSPIKPTYLRAYLDRRNNADKKYYGSWDRSYSKWLETTGSDFYGSVIRSAHFTRAGTGEKTATWSPEFKEEGFYDIYVYMRGKNQNEFHYGPSRRNMEFNYHYIIAHGDGSDDIIYNVSNVEPGWNFLGSYYFNKTGGSIALTDECALRSVYADAIKWVKQ